MIKVYEVGAHVQRIVVFDGSDSGPAGVRVRLCFVDGTHADIGTRVIDKSGYLLPEFEEKKL